MKQTIALIVGGSVSGLALAATLQKQGIEYIIIEKEAQTATPWRNHYERLHLHTNKGLSNLPYIKFASTVPRYPSRQQVVEYLDNYKTAFSINPIFNTEAISIKKQDNRWIVETTKGTFESKYVLIATGPYGKPVNVNFKGLDTFYGKILHSSDYKTGKDFKDQKVLIVGFGNSACEIAIDLYEQGASPSMSVRSPVNVMPRDLLGIPILRISMLMSKLPPRLADAINAPLLRLLFGDITKLGLKKKFYGIFQQIRKDGTIPLIDIGTIKHIRQGNIKIFDNIKYIEDKTVHFSNNSKENFDAIVYATGYLPNHAQIHEIDNSRFEDLKFPVRKQRYFGKDGLYFCGFWIGPTGQFREIGRDALTISNDIANKEKLKK